jgi:hypothetical protein
MIKFHPDKAPADKVEEYTEKAARLNRAKEIILRAQGLSDDSTSPLDRCVKEQRTALPLLRPGQERQPPDGQRQPVCGSNVYRCSHLHLPCSRLCVTAIFDLCCARHVLQQLRSVRCRLL